MSKQPESIGSPDDWSPKLTACRICLDLSIERISDVPLSSFLVYRSDLQQSVEETNCPGCGVLCQAIDRTDKRYGFHFDAVTLWYRDESDLEGLHGLYVDFRCFHHAKDNGPLRRDEFDFFGRHRGLSMCRMDETTPDERMWSADADVEIITPSFEIFWSETKASSNAPVPSSSHPWSVILARPLRSESTGSKPAIQWARSKLDDCKKAHVDACFPAIKSATPLPTRVLDLGDLPLSTDRAASLDTPTVRLYVSDGEEAEYVCLSHCWGSSADHHKRPMETTSKTYGLFQDIIDWCSLPKTFQDAVIFTRGLGIRYLWIDSLCIIQDSTEDWSLEAGKMAAVYSNSALVLAAAASLNSHEGLFREVNTTTELMSKPITMEPGQQRNKLLMRELVSKSLSSYRPIGRTESYLPLFERAWVLQERLLAPRTLFFTPLELVWECLSTTDSESGHLWIDQSLKQSLKQVSHGNTTGPFYEGSVEGAMEVNWRELVQNYLELKLSYSADTLPALAGLAKMFARSFQCEYLAGLWRKTLLSDLLWRRSSTVKSGLAPNLPMAEGIPTWSWACLGGQPVWWCVWLRWYGNSPAFADIVTASCDSRIGDQFVQVDNARVVISGYPIPFVVGTRCRVLVNLSPDSIARQEVLFPCDLPGCDELETEPDYNWLDPPNGRPKIGRGDTIYVMPIMDNSALVLVPKLPTVEMDQPEGGEFVRIGCAQVTAPGLLYYERFRYVYEGESVIAKELERHVEYGQARLDAGEHGGKNIDEYMEQRARFLFDHSERKIPLTYTTSPGIPVKMFSPTGPGLCFSPGELQYNAQLVEELKRQLDIERNRAREWRERQERGEEQVHKRVAVVIV